VLRDRLQAMTEHDVAQHRALLEALSIDCPNSIVLLESPYPIDRYTCVMHVFEFTEKPEYIAIAQCGLGNVFAGAEFAQWLIDHDLLHEIPRVDAVAGDLVFYSNNGQLKHVAILAENERVVSKWGTGYLFEHGLFEVPSSYGTDLRFFKSIAYHEAYEHFTRFAEEKGIRFEDADC